MATNTPNRVQPPALPQAMEAYDRQFQDQYSNVLRLFFNSLDNVLNSVLSADTGGVAIFFPAGNFYSAVDQTASAPNTATPLEFEVTRATTGMTLGGVNNTQVTLSKQGIYTVEVILQAESSNANAKTVTVWAKQDSVDVPYSAQASAVDKIGAHQLSFHFTAIVSPGTVMEFEWATSDLTLSLGASAPTALHPGIASAAVIFTYVSNVEL